MTRVFLETAFTIIYIDMMSWLPNWDYVLLFCTYCQMRTKTEIPIFFRYFVIFFTCEVNFNGNVWIEYFIVFNTLSYCYLYIKLLHWSSNFLAFAKAKSFFLDEILYFVLKYSFCKTLYFQVSCNFVLMKNVPSL